MRYRLPILIALPFGLAACGAAPSHSVSTSASTVTSGSSASAAAVPVRLPGVPLATLTGDAVDMAGVARGRVALVSLWATWCDACQKEMDALNRLEAKSGEEGVVIGVAVGEDRAKVAAFARERGLRYTQLVDSDFAFADALGQRRVPATLVVDRRGEIVFRGDGLDGASLNAFKRALAGTL
jgi:thiol-disulfide isomerase/thioredoxin